MTCRWLKASNSADSPLESERDPTEQKPMVNDRGLLCAPRYDDPMPSPPHDAPRTIRLRRPATLSVLDEPFVPDGDLGLLDEVENRWQALCERNPRYYDGRLYHVIGVHRNGHGGAVLHVADCAYRFHAVQDQSFDLGVRSLGVKGLIEVRGRFLLGRRAMSVANYRGMWEFAPAGVVEPGHRPEETIIAELAEETGLRASHGPTPVAILFDPVVRCWEIVFRIAVAPASIDGAPATAEYDETAWLGRDDLPTNLSPVARQMVPLLT